MARKGRVVFSFECKKCKETIRLPLYFGNKMIWNNSVSPTLQKLYPHRKHKITVVYQFKLD